MEESYIGLTDNTFMTIYNGHQTASEVRNIGMTWNLLEFRVHGEGMAK